MANEQHLALIKQGVDIWNRAREEELWDIQPDLRKSDLSRMDLSGIDLSETNISLADLSSTILIGANFRQARLVSTRLISADLREADLTGADLRGADLRGAQLGSAILREANLEAADLGEAHLSETDLGGAVLVEADIRQTNCHKANFSKANLRGANLSGALLVKTCFQNAILTDCRVYGAGIWDLNLHGAEQSNIIITSFLDPNITVDNLEVAQFIYLLLNNRRIHEVIDTIGKKGVLILGRFSGERKAVLDALRMALRQRNFLPIVFDFKRPTQRDFTETIMILAGLSLFVIADITNSRSAPLELQATVPDYMIPFVPIIAEDEPPFSMFIDLQRKFDWVLDVLTYDSIDRLLAGIDAAVIAPALRKHEELVQRRARVFGTRHIAQYLEDAY